MALAGVVEIDESAAVGLDAQVGQNRRIGTFEGEPESRRAIASKVAERRHLELVALVAPRAIASPAMRVIP